MEKYNHGGGARCLEFIYGAIVYGARAPRQRQEGVQFPRNPFYGSVAQPGSSRGLKILVSAVQFRPDPPYTPVAQMDSSATAF